MKPLLLLALTLLLTACLADQSSSSAAAPAARNLQPVTDAPAEEQPDTTPSFSYTSLSGKQFAQANGALTFAAGEVTDTRCGGRYTVTSATEVDGVITVETSLASGSYADPGHEDCLITTDGNQYYFNLCSTRINKPPKDIAWKITYTIEQISGGVAVTRSLTSKQWLHSCNPNLVYTTDLGSMPEENYFE